MLTTKIYLAESGRVANLDKDFPIYQGQYNNILLNVFVPTNSLAPAYKILNIDYTLSDPFLSGTAVEIGVQSVERNGSIRKSKTYYMRYVKTLKKGNTEYALFERKMPKEFTFFSGSGTNAPKLVINVENIEFGKITEYQVADHIVEIERVVQPNTVVPVTNYYEFVYHIIQGVGSWYYQGTPIDIAKDYGIFVAEAPNEDDKIGLNVVANKPTTINVITSQETALEVLPSNELDSETGEDADAITSIEAYLTVLKASLDLKQDKQDGSLLTQVKTVVGAINELKGITDINADNINENANNIADLEILVNQLQSIVGTGEDFIGTFNFAGDQLPSDEELLTYVRSIKGQSYELKGGDSLIVVLEIAGATDKTYKYIYNGTSWQYYEIPPIETASNGTAGIIQGTYAVGDTNNTLVDIVNGKINNIYLKTANGTYVNLWTWYNSINSNYSGIINGTIKVGYADKADKDGLGNDIANTYLNKTLGASKTFVKDYALPRQFNDRKYLSYNIQTNVWAYTEYENATINQKNYLTSQIGEVEIFSAEYPLNDISLNLYSYNSHKSKFSYAITNTNYPDPTVTFRLEVLATDSNGVVKPLCYQTQEVTVDAGYIRDVEFDSLFSALGEKGVANLNEGGKLTYKLSVIKESSALMQLSILGGVDYSYTQLLVDSQALVTGTVSQFTGNGTDIVMSQKATTDFGTPNDINLAESEVRATYDTDKGVVITAIAEDIRENGDTLNYTTSYNVPIDVDGDLSIDANEDNTKVVISGATKLLITLITPQQTNGTLTEEQLAFLQSKDSNYIEVDDGEGHREKYYFTTDATLSGYRVYAHTEDEPNLIIKSFTIILSVRSWTIQSYDITELLGGKLDLTEPPTKETDFVTIYKGNDGYYQKNLIGTFTPKTSYSDFVGVLRGMQGQIKGQTPPLANQTDLDLINRGELTNKLNEKVGKITQAYKVYTTNENGNLYARATGYSASAGNIPIYDNNNQSGGYNDDGTISPNTSGAIITGIPYKPKHATPKKWVEDNFTVYKHFVNANFGSLNLTIEVLKQSSALITSFASIGDGNYLTYGGSINISSGDISYFIPDLDTSGATSEVGQVVVVSDTVVEI